MKSWKIPVVLFCSLAAVLAALAAQRCSTRSGRGIWSRSWPWLRKTRDRERQGPGRADHPFRAVSFGRLEIADYLISNGAENVNERSNFHMTPLDVACARNAPLSIVRLLVEKGGGHQLRLGILGKPLDLALDTDNAPSSTT